MLALEACAPSAAPSERFSPALSPARAVATVPSCTQPAPGAADPPAPHGLMVWLHGTDETSKEPAILNYLTADPNLCGASIVVLWSQIDKGPGSSTQYDFQPIERAMKPWIAAGKRVNLLLTGTDEVGPTDRATPAWVLAQTGTNHVDLVPCPNPGSGSVEPPTPDLLAYAIDNHAQIFEIYPQDWLTADDPSYPTYAAHHRAWKAAFTQAASTLGG